MPPIYPAAAEKSARTVASPVKLDGVWHHPGSTVHLSDEEAAVYGRSLEGESAGDSTARARLEELQEPQDPTPIPALMKAQAESGDKLMRREVARREGNARVLGGGDGTAYNARVMKAKPPTGDAYPPGGEPQEPTVPMMNVADGKGETLVVAEEALTPLPDEPGEPTNPDPKTPPPAKSEAKGSASVVHSGGSWYEVRFADGRTEKVQGKANADKLAIKG